jgi:ADP-dependent NAD(P)H-hydrate dehydratase / NAD(P)H-hydrate epimerase
MTGAARMAARVAARAGAGLTTIAVPEIAFPIYATAVTSILVHILADKNDLEQLLAEGKFTALLIGPGAGVGETTRANARAMLATELPTLIDADALTSFSDDPATFLAATHDRTVLTPHEGEFARLFNVEGSKAERASFAAQQSGAVIVLKGRETVIAACDGALSSIETRLRRLRQQDQVMCLAALFWGYLPRVWNHSWPHRLVFGCTARLRQHSGRG